MCLTSWKIAAISLLVLGAGGGGGVLAGQENASRDRRPASRNAILEREISGLKQELKEVRDQLKALEQNAARPARPATTAAHPLPWLSKGAEDAKSKAILQKLEEPISMSFANETPLEDVLKYIKSATQGPNDIGIPIYVDPAGLVDAEKTMTSPVALDLEGVPLRLTLHFLLKQVGLTYMVHDGVLTISTASAMEHWPPAQLLERAMQGEFGPEQLQQLIEQVKAVGELRKAVEDLRTPGGRQSPPAPARK